VTAVLDATASTDGDGDPLAYTWFTVAGSGTVTFSSITGPNPTASFVTTAPTAVGQTASTTYLILLEAEDCPGLADYDLLTITHECIGQ
jgi:hypothetical protein